MRASQRKIRRARSPQEEDYNHVVYMSPRKRSRIVQALPNIYAPRGQRFRQHSNLPIPLGQLGLLESIPGTTVSHPPLPKLLNEGPQGNGFTTISLHHRKRIAQNKCWTTEVIPELVQPYLHLLRETQNLRFEPLVLETQCTCLAPGKTMSVLVLRVYSKNGIRCLCNPILRFI